MVKEKNLRESPNDAENRGTIPPNWIKIRSGECLRNFDRETQTCVQKN